jgi:Toprim domain
MRGFAMPSFIADLARRLADEAEAVCQHYLSNGHRVGQYWLVGDARNTPGQSLYVRLTGAAASRGRAGKWTDAANGEHGDLLDIIRETRGLTDIHAVADEACSFLSLPRPDVRPDTARSTHGQRASSAAQRLLAISRRIAGTLAESYLRNRGITRLQSLTHLHFYPRCYIRSGPDGPPEARPAMIAAVTDLAGRVTGLQRTWLDPSGARKAQIATPRRAMGDLLGHAVRFGTAEDILGVGEGIETTLSVREALPGLPVAAALSAAHLAAIQFPPTLRRLYILRDNDPAGAAAAQTLTNRAHSAGIDAIVLVPHLGDFNDDLRAFGAVGLAANLRVQLAAEDVVRLLQGRPEHAGME